MYKITLSMLLIALVVGISGCSKHRYHDPEKRADYITKKIAKKLDLNEEQKKKLEAVKIEYLSNRKEFHRDRDKLVEQLIAQIKSPKMEEDQLNNIIEKQTTLFQQMSPKVVNKLVEFHASLNEKQKTEIVENLQKYHQRKK